MPPSTPPAPDPRVHVAWRAHAGGRGEPQARAWLAGRVGCEPDALPLARGPHGRPELALPPWDCSWSHSGAHLVIALGEGVRVGVDVEVRRARPNALAIARRYFTPREAETLAALEPAARDDAFLRLWCAKEAVLKAQGRGLAFGLDRLCIAGWARPGAPLQVAEADTALGAGWQLRDISTPTAIAILGWR